MSDPMTEKDQKCEGCIRWNGSYNEYPCKICTIAHSENSTNWYKEKESKKGYETGITATAVEYGPFPIPKETTAKEIESLYKTVDSSTEEDTYLTKLIDDHWAYIDKLIDVTQMHSNPKEKAIAEFHYKSAFKHGFKHALEWVEDK